MEKSPTLAADTALSAGGDSHRGPIPVNIRMHIPRWHRGERMPTHPAIISPLTLSVSIAVNGGKAKIYNATPSSPNCSAGPSGTTCTFKSAAPPGGDTFAVKTFSGAGGTGSVLDYGTAVVNIARGKSNAASVSLGPVVSTTADSGMGSLRFAIASAGPGDTVMFLLPASSTVVLSSPITINNTVGIAGPGVTASARRARIERNGRRSAATYSGLTISGNNANQLFVVNAGGTLTVSGLILTAGKAAVAHQPGGAIYNVGTLSLVNDALTSSASIVSTVARVHRHRVHKNPRPGPADLHPHACTTTYFEGGSVYNNGTLTVTGSTFDGNIASSDVYPSATHCEYGYGGAIYNDSNGVLTATNSTFVNNSAYYGGAVYNGASSGLAAFTGDKFSSNSACSAVSGCPTAGCTPSGSCTSYAYGYGAAIYDDSGPGVIVASSTFTGNTVGDSPAGYGEGGAIYLDTGSPSITGSTFTSNYAGGGSSNCSSGYGGALINYATLLEIDNDTFTSNFAGGDSYGYGGAIYGDTTEHGSNDTFTSNVAAGNGSSCSGSSSAYGYGGAIYDYYVSLSNSTFSNNVATGEYYGYGGAVYISDPSKFTNDTFTSNVATGTGVRGSYSYAYGGALYLSDDATLSNSTFTSNSAVAVGQYGYYAYGGAVYNSSGTLGSTKNTFTSNSATAKDYYDAYVYGGAVSNQSTMISNGDTFKSNTASAPYEVYGGAIDTESTLTMVGGTVTGNVATGGSYEDYGGGVYNDSTANITNSVISSNAASSTGNQGYGGGIYDGSGGSYNGLLISGNTASTGGGGFYSNSTDSINNSTITGNSVTAAANGYGGGGVYNDGPSTITNSTISGNAVTVAAQQAGGGGIFNEDALSMTGTTVSGNKVLGSLAFSGGGGIFNDSTATLSNSTITGNSSSIDGGGFLTNSTDDPLLINVTMFQNSAAGTGGNIANPYYVTLANSIVAGGTAATSADVSNTGTLYSDDYNIIGTPVIGGTFTPSTHDLYADPKLLAMANNGGPTMTNADQSISPGKAYIPFAGSMCDGFGGTGADQRGFVRGAGSKCDVGAYEFGGTPSAIRVHAPAVRADPHHHHRRTPQRHPHSKNGLPANQKR